MEAVLPPARFDREPPTAADSWSEFAGSVGGLMSFNSGSSCITHLYGHQECRAPTASAHRDFVVQRSESEVPRTPKSLVYLGSSMANCSKSRATGDQQSFLYAQSRPHCDLGSSFTGGMRVTLASGLPIFLEDFLVFRNRQRGPSHLDRLTRMCCRKKLRWND